MRSLARLALSLVLVLALVTGQQAVLWHDLGHAGELLSSHAAGSGTAGEGDEGGHEGAPAQCDEHFACAQLSGALGSAGFVGAFVASTPPRAGIVRARQASLAPRLNFLSRAPPASLG